MDIDEPIGVWNNATPTALLVIVRGVPSAEARGGSVVTLNPTITTDPSGLTCVYVHPVSMSSNAANEHACLQLATMRALPCD